MKEKRLITLKNNSIELIILPFAGGRVVSVSVNNSANLLSSDTNLWNYKFPKPVDRYTGDDFMQFRGHTTWLGPQSEWWLHQNKAPEKKAKKDVWPPDPFWEYGNFEVINQTDNSICLLGEKSCYTGVQLKKKYTLLPNNSVEVFVEATNSSDTPVSWDIWLNTRLPEDCKCYVPILTDGVQKIEPLPNDEKVLSYPYSFLKYLYLF